MIGTVAVLAGFAVVERSVDASTGRDASCTPTDAHVLLPRGETVPVRAEPTLDSPAIGTLQGHAVVSVLGGQGGWARIAVGAEPYGWVQADRLGIDARSGSALYSRPGPLGQNLATLDGDTARFRLLGCRGTRLQVIDARNGVVWIDQRRRQEIQTK
ncbi:SH3 domain-containing protein [Reyranella sp.]|uniref:SH3 domain-containing protein n=1 Tax=Reyranella sp. TaxID=1929291 RepID=UPI0025D47A83|nr:SH3 domain-containing protein [Reyranella sp.]